MAPAPAVRDLNALVNEIGQAYKPQYDTIQNDINFNEQSGQGATAGLQAQQRQAFSGIEQQAQNKGMFFSGFSPAEQANYTSTVYLPKLAELNQTIAQTRNALLGRKAELDTGIRNQAFQTREQDTAALRDWQQRQEQMRFEAEQNRLKMEQERQLQAQQIAAQRAASRASNPANNVAENIRAMLDSRTGADGKVSPTTWRQVAAYAYDNGIKFGGPQGFASKYWQYVNPKYGSEYQQGYEKYMK